VRQYRIGEGVRGWLDVQVAVGGRSRLVIKVLGE